MGRPVKDYMGQVFGRLKVLERSGSSKQGFSLWSCLCSCGQKCIKTSIALTNGTQSCGCLHRERTSEAKKSNLMGRVYGRLTIVSSIPSKNGVAVWSCQCTCGKLKKVSAGALTTGRTKSCGCLGRESRITRNTKHGKARRGMKTPEYSIWAAAKTRAKRRGLEFTLTLEEIVIPATCPILGLVLCGGTRGSHDSSPSLDRITPNKGYTSDNTWIISYRANRIKNDASPEELEAVASAVRQRIDNNG